MQYLNLRTRGKHSGRGRTPAAMLLIWCLFWFGMAPLVHAQSGSIHPESIEIDNFANHYDDGGVNTKNNGTVDWVKDSLTNGDPGDGTPALANSVANWISAGLTGATGGTGHWNGVRIVDSAATLAGNKDPDAFLSGGKVNDTTSWNIGSGVVGGPKFDASQAYLANNQTFLYFGMERLGNNGTTAFEFEFNQLAPTPNPGNPNDGYIPNRSDGDVIFGFELQGSGGDSGSVATFVLRYSGTTGVYSVLCDDITGGALGCDELPAPYSGLSGPLSSINQDGTTAPPWGKRDSQGNWEFGTFDRRLFAEAQVPLGLLPGVNSCGGSAFVQIRTRASITFNSDAKDTTKIFEYKFGGPSAAAAITPSCNLQFGFSGAGSENAAGGTTNLSYDWIFQRYDPTNAAADADGYVNEGTATGLSGNYTALAEGKYRAKLTVQEGGVCPTIAYSTPIDVRNALEASASKTSAAVNLLGNGDSGFSATLTGSTNALSGDTVTFQWQRKSGANWVSITGQTAATLNRTMADLITDGSTEFDLAASILGDSYKLNRVSLEVRLAATRTLNGVQCGDESPGVLVRAFKAIDP